MNRAPKSTEAFDELIAALQEIRDGYVLNDQRFTDDLDVVEGFRYVTEVLSGASEFFMEADPDHPRMASIVTPARKLQGDNPDSIYHFARIDGGRSYRVYGVRARSRTSRSPSTRRRSTAASTGACSPTSTTASSRSPPTAPTRSCSAPSPTTATG